MDILIATLHWPYARVWNLELEGMQSPTAPSFRGSLPLLGFQGIIFFCFFSHLSSPACHCSLWHLCSLAGPRLLVRLWALSWAPALGPSHRHSRDPVFPKVRRVCPALMAGAPRLQPRASKCQDFHRLGSFRCLRLGVPLISSSDPRSASSPYVLLPQ